MTITQKLMKLTKKNTHHTYDKYIATPEFNKLTTEKFTARLLLANLVTKTDFDNKQINLNKKINSNKAKHLIVESELKKLEIFDSIYLHGQSHFKDDGTQNHLVFQTAYRYFKTVSINNSNILSWKLSDESIKPPSTSNKILNPSVNYVGTKARVKFNGDCLKQDKISFDNVNKQ